MSCRIRKYKLLQLAFSVIVCYHRHRSFICKTGMEAETMKTRWHSKSFFIRFLVSYVMILIIPFLTLLLTYFITQQSIRNEILNSNANSLHQFFNVVDSKLAEMTSCAYQVLQDFSIKSIAYSPQNTFNGYKIYEARKYLSASPRRFCRRFCLLP